MLIWRHALRIMWIGRSPWQDSKLNTRIQGLSRSRKIWEMLKMWEWQPEGPNIHLTRCWMRLVIVCATLPVRMISRKGKKRRMIKIIQSWASWVKMSNPAEWQAQSPKQFRITRRVVGNSRWSLPYRHNWDGEMRPTTSMRGIKKMGGPYWRYRQSLSLKWKKMELHLHCSHLDSVRRLLTSCRKYRKCHKGPLNQDVVIWGYIPGNHSLTNSLRLSHMSQLPIWHWFRN